MNFPKPERGVQLRGNVDGEMWSAGSAEWDRRARSFFGVLRHQGSPRWRCHERHDTSHEARLCAAAELKRRLAAKG